MAPRRSGRPAPDPKRVARALTLHRPPHNMTLAAIGQELGVSAQTARNWIMLAQDAERWLPTYTRAEIAANATGVLLQLQARGMRALDEDGADYPKIATALVGVLRLLVDIHGAKAPTRIDMTTSDEPHPDPAMLAAVRRAQDIEAAELAELEGKPRPEETP
jgi:hypothetical protein